MTDPRTLRAQARIGQVLCGKWKVDYVITENVNDKNVPIGGKLTPFNA